MLEPVTRDPLANDFTLAFIAVRIGFDHGWDHIYSLTLQHQLFTQWRPTAVFNDGQRFIAPPPLAWITVPFSFLGAAGAFYAWLVVSIAALVAAWWIGAPGAGRLRLIWLLAAIGWYPVLYALSYGQPAPLVLVAAVGCWCLAEVGRPYLAGLVLAAGMSLKPQLILAVPVVLLAAGRWRVILTWSIGLGVLALVSILSLGVTGLQDYRSLLTEAQTLANNRYFTLAYVLGPGSLSYFAQAVVLLFAAVVAYVNRHASYARLIALGVVASAFGTTYWHLQDFTILLAAAWLFWREQPPAWQKWWVALVAISAELAWPLKPLPLLIALGVWLVLIAIPSRPAPDRRPQVA